MSLLFGLTSPGLLAGNAGGEAACAVEAEASPMEGLLGAGQEAGALDPSGWAITALSGGQQPVPQANQCACTPTCHDPVTGCTAPCNLSTNCRCAFWMCPI